MGEKYVDKTAAEWLACLLNAEINKMFGCAFDDDEDYACIGDCVQNSFTVNFPDDYATRFKITVEEVKD
jgi:hypothetical protein